MTDLDSYLSVSKAYSPAMSGSGDRLAYLSDVTGRSQVWVADGPDPDDHTQLTADDCGTQFVSWSPSRPDLVIGRSHARENQDLFRLHVPTGEVTRLTERDDTQYRWGGWAPDGDRFAFVANQQGAGGFDVYVQRVDRSDPSLVRTMDGWHDVAGWGPEGDRLVLTGGASQFDMELYVLDVASGESTPVTPFDDAVQLSSLNWGPDGEALYFVTDHDASSRYIGRLDVTEGSFEVVAGGGDWPVEGVAVSPDAERAIYGRNVEGYTEVVTASIAADGTFTDRRTVDATRAVMGDVALAPTGNRAAVTATNRTTPPNVFVVDLATGQATQWTDVGHLPDSAFVTPEGVTISSHDGLSVPAWVTLPTVGEPPYPAIVDLHGGPNEQRRPSIYPARQYFLSQGFALVEPNVRGSTGYGSEYAQSDACEKRADAVGDVRAVAEWTADHGSVDGDRLGVLGTSYGGYLALMTMTRHPSLWACGAVRSAIVDLVTYLEGTAEWRRAARVEEYGDPESDRELLRELSPVSTLDRLSTPVLAVHGEQDPRVPVEQIRQFTAQAPDEADVETLVFEDEGHSFQSPATKREALEAIDEFFQKHIG